MALSDFPVGNVWESSPPKRLELSDDLIPNPSLTDK